MMVKPPIDPIRKCNQKERLYLEGRNDKTWKIVIPERSADYSLAFVLGAFMAFCLAVMIAVKYQ